jgi:hypothetical protein
MQYVENRAHPRFEPPFVDAIIILERGDEIEGRVLDSSRGGMAIALSDDISLNQIENTVNVSIRNAVLPPGTLKRPVGNALVVRKWSDPGFLDNAKGIALKFENELEDPEVKKCLLHGPHQETRLKSQAQLAKIDIEYLGDYRRDIIGCQVKLFALSLTLGVALAGAYFGLSYHSVAANLVDNPSLSFWRTMVAALPGLLAVACAMMVIQKSISVQRIDAYLLILKNASLWLNTLANTGGGNRRIVSLGMYLGAMLVINVPFLENVEPLKKESNKHLS